VREMDKKAFLLVFLKLFRIVGFISNHTKRFKLKSKFKISISVNTF
jgi:hypothetical protein